MKTFISDAGLLVVGDILVNFVNHNYDSPADNRVIVRGKEFFDRNDIVLILEFISTGRRFSKTCSWSSEFTRVVYADNE